MGKEKAISGSTGGGLSPLWHSLLSTDLYKRSQGRLTRQITGIVIAVIFALAAWRMYEFLHASKQVASAAVYGAPALLLVAGLWLAYRLVNMPSFADFLIAVEAEMNKVSWPTRTELVRCSIVVIVMLLSLAVILAVYDNLLRLMFLWILK